MTAWKVSMRWPMTKPVGLDASEADLDWLYESLPHETDWRVLGAGRSK